MDFVAMMKDFGSPCWEIYSMPIIYDFDYNDTFPMKSQFYYIL